ncbi:MAG: Rrf2 family transcriptional regulator [Planctomycetes bacterium]|nr:Rrf2 family transcriptional regulator [Planctomycetota bacterium]
MSYPYFYISKKSGYAIRALFELAQRGTAGPVNVRSLAKAQDIPSRFLEIILNELKQGGFVLSVRGKSGGYLLSRGASEITIGQIIQFLEHSHESDAPALSTPHPGEFVLSALMTNINDAISEVCDNTSLKDMMELEMKNRAAFTSNYII